MGNYFNKKKQIIYKNNEDIIEAYYGRLYFLNYSYKEPTLIEQMKVYYNDDGEHQYSIKTNVDAFIKFCKKYKSLSKFTINISINVENIMNWKFFNKVSRVFIDLDTNIIMCTIQKISFIYDGNEQYLKFEIGFNDNNLQDGTTIKYLYKVCTQANFNIVGVLQSPIKESTQEQQNVQMIKLYDQNLYMNISLYQNIFHLDIELIESDDFGLIILPNLTEVTLKWIRISNDAFKSFLDNNSTIHTFNCMHHVRCIDNPYDSHYEHFVKNTNIVNLSIKYLSSRIVCKILFYNTVIEKLNIERMHHYCQIMKINNNFKWLSITDDYLNLDVLHIIAKSQLMYVKIPYNSYKHHIHELIEQYPDNIPLASLLYNTHRNKLRHSLIKYSNNIIRKHTTLEYLLDDKVIYYKMFSNRNID